MLRADVLLSWSVPLRHLHSLHHSGLNKVIPFGATIKCVAPVGSVQLVEFLRLFVVVLKEVPCRDDPVPLIGCDAQSVFGAQADVHQEGAELFHLLEAWERIQAAGVLLLQNKIIP